MDAVAQVTDATDEVAMGYFKTGTAYRVSSVEHSPVGQYNARRKHHFVTVGMGATVHARGIVHNDASHHGALYGSRVWGELASIGGKEFIDPLSHNTRLKGNLSAVGTDGVLFPVFAGHDENGVADGLSRQTGACRTERDGQLQAIGQPEQFGHVVFAIRTDDYLGNETVESRIGAPCQATQLVRIYSVLRDEA